jgi:hypothetical protein
VNAGCILLLQAFVLNVLSKNVKAIVLEIPTKTDPANNIRM